MNNRLWNMFKQSEEGQKALALFDVESESYLDNVYEIMSLLKERDNSIDPQSVLGYVALIHYNLMNHELLEGDFSKENFEKFAQEFELYNYDITEDDEVVLTDELIVGKDKYRQKAALIEQMSLFFYFNYEEMKPILFASRFDIFQQYCDALSIELPPIPRSNNYKNYLLYYYDICAVLNEFQEKNELTDAELCACLYFFAPLCVNDKSEKTELPQPTNVWFTGTKNQNDFDLIDKIEEDPSITSIWACNERTRKGDIVVMYCTSPRKYIHSIWRAVDEGIFNPFDYYHSRSKLGHGVMCPKITFEDLKADPFMCQLPIVRKNLQGINGVELKPNEYSMLLNMMEKEGDISRLPRLLGSTEIDFGEMKKEKEDVEERILIPILKELGYEESDWTRQLSLKAGRKEKAIPDFVFFPTGEKHFETAPFIIEAKLDMSSVVEQKNAFNQGHSYAKMLRSKMMGICDKERLIIYRVDEDGNINRNAPIFENHWVVIYTDANVKARLNQIIGKNVVKSI